MPNDLLTIRLFEVMLGIHAYHCAIRLSVADHPFYALIGAAMLRADSDNFERLKFVFPEVWRELQERYNAPLGVIPSDGEIDMEVLRKTLREL